jgi:microcystin-dependent protein
MSQTLVSPAMISPTGSTAGQVLTSTGPSTPPAFQTPSSVPSGAVMPFAGSAAPSGWLFARGQAVSRTTYAALFTAISTTYGVGDGSTTFNLPDLRGRVAAGRDDMGGSAANRITSGGSGIVGTTLGATGGTETHTLTTAQLASHSHTISGGNGGGAGWLPDTPVNGVNIPVSTNTAGSGNAHQNTQPTIMLNYIIKE